MLHFPNAGFFTSGSGSPHLHLLEVTKTYQMSSILNSSRMQIGSLQQSLKLQTSCFAAPVPSFPPHLQNKETSSRPTLGFKHSLFGIFLKTSAEDSFKENAEDDVEPLSSIKYQIRVMQGCAKIQIWTLNIRMILERLTERAGAGYFFKRNLYLTLSIRPFEKLLQDLMFLKTHGLKMQRKNIFFFEKNKRLLFSSSDQ